jgi:uncharacterized protein YuzE
MKLEFDPIADALYLEISDSPVEKSDEIKPGIILDYDAAGNIVGVEVLSVSKRSTDHLPFKIAA